LFLLGLVSPARSIPSVGSLPPYPVSQLASAYAEPALAVSPHDPLTLLGGAIAYVGGTPGVVSFRSADGGSSWEERPMSVPEFSLTYDPSVSFFGPSDVAFAEVAVASGGGGGTVAVFISGNGGRTWSAPHLIGNNQGTLAFADKPVVVGDPATGDIYLAWSNGITSATTNPAQAIPTENALLVATSHDDGRSFRPPVRIRVPGYPSTFAAAMVPTAAGLVVAFEASRRSVSPIQAATYVVRSTDRGASFSRPERVGPVEEPAVPAGAHLYPNSWPSIATDPVGDVFVAWSSGASATRVLVAEQPAGRVWFAPPHPVPGPGADLMPALGYGPVLGFLSFDEGTVRPEVSVLGTNGFMATVPAGPPGPAGSPYQLGEYLGVQTVLGRVAMLWPQVSDGRQEAMFARTSLKVPARASPTPSSSGSPAPSTHPPSHITGASDPISRPGSGSGVSLPSLVAIGAVAGLVAIAVIGRSRARSGGRHRSGRTARRR
jgi:hypothetical protein